MQPTVLGHVAIMRRIVLLLALGASGAVLVAVAGLGVLISTTSAPQIPPPPLPTATAGPAISPNSELQARILNNADPTLSASDLSYADRVRPHSVDLPCRESGQWSLTVNPQDVVGRPDVLMPGQRDWARADHVIGVAMDICPTSILLTWLGHYAGRAAFDRWTVLMPASVARRIDNVNLQRYATQHVQPE